jgi:rusticyanin
MTQISSASRIPEEPDMQYALGHIDREEYLKSKGNSISGGRSRGPPARRRFALVALVIGAFSVMLIMLLVAILAGLSPVVPSISFSPPEKFPRTAFNATTASEGDYLAFPKNNTIWVRGASQLVVLASPLGHDETFVILNLTNPTIHLSRDVQLTLALVNADPASYHDLLLTTRGPPYGNMPMMQMMNEPGTMMLPPYGQDSFWVQNIHIVANAPGQYWYLCLFPDHAQMGMYGKLIFD